MKHEQEQARRRCRIESTEETQSGCDSREDGGWSCGAISGRSIGLNGSAAGSDHGVRGIAVGAVGVRETVGDVLCGEGEGVSREGATLVQLVSSSYCVERHVGDQICIAAFAAHTR